MPSITIRGRPASAGQFTGAARVLLNVEDYPSLKTGEVAISPSATPELATVLDRAGAVVADVGGVLSHVVVVALQLGIPAVVGTGVATRRIRNGTVVTVDGTRGLVVVAGRPRRAGRSKQSPSGAKS